MSKQSSVGSWVAAGVVVLAIGAGGLYLARKAMNAGDAPLVTPRASSATPVATAQEQAVIEHPIEQARTAPAEASTTPLPALDGSDESVADGLGRLAAGSDWSALLIRQRIIERIVATLDALPRHEALGSFTLPAHTPKGPVLVDDVGGSIVLAANNSERYAPYLQVVDATDPRALVAWYVHAYPLFQQAYQQLGYPKGYFNDRLIVVLDDLLAAPDLAARAPMRRSNAYYVYADPALESLSTGQKLMMRVGPEAEARIKAKLRAIRAQLVGAGLHAAPAGTPSEKIQPAPPVD
ncbi:DUF3014 domain-containing protein [Rhodanobacter sp. AS-Z3]|uniref:DUF3014 domain-containing protein n=1 Tax=Rhodanobacter sp. AS-Z3 TaxID=3031330 RepID=UPI0024797939|nr:DUF3014 domain-containing protein [Rhodanobacter sp. AS-Z3]WEN14199.1 DUF3014 domain-containing protein [Rhodanobacter sp. AS-Z3]